jgi:hypothetical protein
MKKETKNKEKKGKSNLRKYNLALVTVLIVVAIGFVWASSNKPCCAGSKQPGIITEPPVSGNSTEIVPTPQNSSVKVEVYHFHGTHQCSSCIRLGELAEKTANTYFADELASGKLVFGHINYDLPENSELSDKFEVTGSSLWIGTTRDGIFYKEEDTNVWYKLSDEASYMNYLKGILDKRLKGDLS